ncbi:MAG TPA: dTDP-4-dehydrorhamnose reductase [Desulfobacterales bacterium]|nr:dTDP-4-dehydrorhamnose reductase [Desulfobacterales bacterium]HIP39584.1 dTDP-4-dehydrorhamnose reductase [Desulfocapsa sulfexigens]
MKVIITGGHGQLGSDVYSVLEREHDVFSYGSKELDIGDRKKVDSIISRHQPDILINCAAYTAVDNCETEKKPAWRVNADGPANLALAMEAYGGRIIHISTDYVFNGNKPSTESYKENDPVEPLSEYGKSKLAGEQAIAEYCSNHLILRTAWLYGWHGKNFLKTMLRLALADSTRELKVVDDQYGSLTWTATLARQIQTILSSDLQGIVHATAEGACTWYQGACYFLDAMEIPYNISPCSTSEYPTPAHRPSNSILANNRLEQADLSVFNSWQEDITRFVELHKYELIEEAMQV